MRGLPVNPSGLYCTFSSCSSSNPCSSGTCNNGYCCSSGSSSAIMLQPANTGCVGCNQNPPIITIPSNSCPGGGYAVGTCNSGYCSPGYSCVSGSCCPSYNPQPSVRVYTCPSGSPAVGACISGSCASGYSCVSGSCCPATTTQNPFVCPDGTQAAGGCVNGQCGTGYTCSNGLCCAGTSTTVRCLDGSEAVGACIPSCQGNACGGSTVSYYCGSGYTCTTGNICCAINSCPNGGDVLGPSVNGLCPTGYVAQGSICCSAMCADGTAGSAQVNGACPTGFTAQNGVCCASVGLGDVSCTADIAAAQGCVAGACADVGYACDTATSTQCCPVVQYNNPEFQLGPGVGGLCPLGFAIVYIPGVNVDDDGVNQGTCVNLQSIPGICDIDQQNGPCQTGSCSAGFTCFTVADVCCPTTTLFRKLRPGQRIRPVNQKPTYGRPLHSYMPPRKDLTCPDGSAAGGACMNGLCGIGHDCINGLCCPPQSSNSQIELKSVCPNGKTAVSGCFTDGTCGFGFECVKSQSLCCPPGGNDVNSNNNNFGNSGVSMTIRPIGARCHQDSECVGHVDGLSMCHAGVCQCSPIAYSQGIACVRRKALNMMMNDQPMEVEKTNGVAASN
ncbi:unnamed protein product [Auanema sp. JU1783]|nr:unnamed protein product [Auanema sp. JU1783]